MKAVFQNYWKDISILNHTLYTYLAKTEMVCFFLNAFCKKLK